MPFSLRLLAACLLALISGIVFAQSSGTAFVVAPGLLVTNHHVIEGCGAIEVIASDGRRPATVVDSVQQIDLALLRVYGLRGGVAALRTQSPALLGESATVFGFPLGGALSSTGNFTTGVVSSLRGLRDAAGEIQITAPVQPGNSGGPVLDRAGAVIGVVQSKLDALRAVRATGDIPQNVNFAVSLDVLADFLAKNSVSFKAVNRQAALETTQVAEMAQTFTYKISCTAASRTAAAPRPQPPAPNVTPAAPTPTAPTPDRLVQDIQTALNQKGFNAGPADGFIGPQTQAAISSAQKALGLLPITGVPSDALLAAIKGMVVAAVGATYQDAAAAYKNRDFPTAFRIFRELALKGDATAQNELGFMYQSGLSVAIDYAEALKWYKLSAAQGYAQGQNNLGSMYHNGYGVSKDYAEAFKWYRLSAAQGNAHGQANLGAMYRNGLGVVKDDAEAFKWYRLSAAQGNAQGQNNLGMMYHNGYGVSQDYAEALKWYRLSAAQGNANGQVSLGALYQTGLGVATDYAEALKWYRLSAAQGNANGQVSLGALYQTGLGVATDYAEALKWYRLSAAQGYAKGQASLGNVYRNGYGVSKDYAEALKWYRLSAAQGYAHGQNNLGFMYHNGFGTSQDYAEALKWYRLAAAQGYALAKQNLETLAKRGVQ
jgi:TPR repeat protein/S1-C subfamily serine protease